MREKELIQQLSTSLNDAKRLQHSIRVKDKALTLMHRFDLGVAETEVKKAALLHDYAKRRSTLEFSKIIEDNTLNPAILREPKPLLHAFLGPLFIKSELKITNPKVLNAVYYHTTGSDTMDLLAEIIFLADFIELGRNSSIASEIRNVAQTNFKKAIALKFAYLLATIKQPHRYTRAGYQKYKIYLKE